MYDVFYPRFKQEGVMTNICMFICKIVVIKVMERF